MSFIFIEKKYAKLVGRSIDRFKVKKEIPFHANGRCPVCGDSHKSKSKTRFHIIEHSGVLFTKCFNCDYSNSLANFLKDFHPNLYTDFVFERYREDDSPVIKTETPSDETFIPKHIEKVVKEELTKFELDLPYVSDLPEDNPLREYIKSRKLPDYPFQVAPRFFEFSSQFNPDFCKCRKDEPRLIIPFFDKTGSVFAYQGRDLTGTSDRKYITVMVNKKIPKIFGIDRVDFKKDVLIVEGPIDSLFLNNCLASVNASLVATAKKLKSILNKNSITIIYDNEPRNPTIVKAYEHAIIDGYKIVIWPESCTGVKDVNDMVLSGRNPTDIIEANTYQGLSAQLEFQRWKRC